MHLFHLVEHMLKNPRSGGMAPGAKGCIRLHEYAYS
jgi:hypothetical protein